MTLVVLVGTASTLVTMAVASTAVSNDGTCNCVSGNVNRKVLSNGSRGDLHSRNSGWEVNCEEAGTSAADRGSSELLNPA